MTPGDGAGTAISPLILVGRDDRQLIVEGSIARIGDKAGTLLVLRDVTERIRSERRRDAQYAVTKVLAECSTMDEAAPHLLKAICESLGWAVGILWTMDKDTNQLLPVEFWHSDADTVPAFGSGRARPNFSPGAGLPGEVWAGKKPVWLSDMARDARFPEAQQAAKELLHGAFAFPIMSKEKVLGVMEFFSHEVRQPDHDLLQMFSSIGTQIGHVLERRQLERQVREVRDQ
jgi:GAF domain-containing protein